MTLYLYTWAKILISLGEKHNVLHPNPIMITPDTSIHTYRLIKPYGTIGTFYCSCIIHIVKDLCWFIMFFFLNFAGSLAMFFTWLYPQRSIHQLKLLKGGQKLQITTYSHFGRTRAFTVPLEHVSSQQARSAAHSTISLKVKGKWFYYLMDKKGHFNQPALFDYVVGLKRTFKKWDFFDFLRYWQEWNNWMYKIK